MTDRTPYDQDIRNRGRKGGGTGGFRYPGAPAPPPGAPPGGAGGGLSIRPTSPLLDRPPQGTDFYRRGYEPAATAGTTPAVLPGSAYELPSNEAGVIRSLVLTVNTLLLTSELTWRLRFNGSPVAGWNQLQVVPGAVAYFATSFGPDETQIPVPPGATIDIQVVVADAAAYAIGATYHGWHFNQRLLGAAEQAWV